MATINIHTIPEGFVATHQLNYTTYQLENLQLPFEETAINFEY